MSAEYVRVTPGEISYGAGNLLQSQLNLIQLLKKYQEYEILRKEELFLKIELKKKLGEAKEYLDMLSKALPESRFLEEQEKKERLQKEFARKVETVISKPEKAKLKEGDVSGNLGSIHQSSLDQELEEIRRKLEKLQ